MAQRVLLDAPPNVVDGPVGQGDGVKRVDHQDGVGQMGGHAVGVAPEGVDGHRVDAGQPRRGSGAQPVVHRLAAATSDDVEEATPIQVHEVGGEGGVAVGVGPQEGDLVEAQRPHVGAPVGIVDQRSAVVVDSRHDRRPAHPEVPGHTRHRPVLLAHLTAGLGPGPLRHRRPGGDLGGPLGPAGDVAVGLGAAPDALGPHHHHPPPAGGQVPHPHPAPALGQCPGAAGWAAHHRRRRLHQLVQLARRAARTAEGGSDGWRTGRRSRPQKGTRRGGPALPAAPQLARLDRTERAKRASEVETRIASLL